MAASVQSASTPAVETARPLEGKVAWVTGASRGLGRACALELAAAGARVAVTARSESALQDVRDAIVGAGGEALAVPGSVAVADEVGAAVARIREAWGGVDVLVANAGISPLLKRSELLEDDEWRQVIDVNLSGTFYCCREAGRLMLDAGGGSIVVVSSVHGTVGLGRLVAYAASKGGLELLARTLAVEWADRGVRVNVVAPGYLETEMTVGLREAERWRSELLRRIPLGRFGGVDDVVGAVLFLASDPSRYITGSTIFVDGGWTAQ